MCANKPAINVIDYVDWLLKQPLHTRVALVDFEEACAVARTLQATCRVTEKKLVGDLSSRIWNRALELTSGDLASPRACLRFLEEFSDIYLDENQCKAAAEVIRSLSQQQKAALKSFEVQKEMVHYRGRLGAVYIGRQGKRRWPQDDLTFRLLDLYRALREAGCPQAAAFLAHRLKWTTNRVESRLRPYKGHSTFSWMASQYRMGYWLQLDPANQRKPVVEEQPFVFTWQAPANWPPKRKRKHGIPG